MKAIVLKDISPLIRKGDILVRKGKYFIKQGMERGVYETKFDVKDPDTNEVTQETVQAPNFYLKEQVLELKGYFKILR